MQRLLTKYYQIESAIMKIVFYEPLRFIQKMQGRVKAWKSIDIIHHINRVKKKITR